MSARPGVAQASHRPAAQHSSDGMAWRMLAACRYAPLEIFFPQKTGIANATEAKAVCRTCHVSDECLRYALEHDERHGVWGGLSEKERKKLRRARRRGAA